MRLLPPAQVGRCVLDGTGRLERSSPGVLAGRLAGDRVTFHEGRIRGAFPELRGI